MYFQLCFFQSAKIKQENQYTNKTTVATRYRLLFLFFLSFATSFALVTADSPYSLKESMLAFLSEYCIFKISVVERFFQSLQ